MVRGDCQYAARGVLGVMIIAAVATILATINSPSPSSLLSSGTIEFSDGARAVLTSGDFVPLGRHTSMRKLPQSAQNKLRALYAAAGIRMHSGSARQQQLAEVSYPVRSRSHQDIDSGSAQRLKAAAQGRLYAYDYERFPETKSAVEQRRIRTALGITLAKYFSKQQQK